MSTIHVSDLTNIEYIREVKQKPREVSRNEKPGFD
jgi:hypothetical protein